MTAHPTGGAAYRSRRRTATEAPGCMINTPRRSLGDCSAGSTTSQLRSWRGNRSNIEQGKQIPCEEMSTLAADRQHHATLSAGMDIALVCLLTLSPVCFQRDPSRSLLKTCCSIPTRINDAPRPTATPPADLEQNPSAEICLIRRSGHGGQRDSTTHGARFFVMPDSALSGTDEPDNCVHGRF